METIELFKQENDKLNARLAKAVEVFKEQKAQIEQLTNEVKEKTSLAMDYRNKIEELTNTIKSKDQAYNNLQETYNEVFAENKQLKDQVESCEFNAESDASNLTDLQSQLNEYKLKLQKLEGDYKDLKKVYEDEQSEYENLSADYQAAINCNERNNKELTIATEKLEQYDLEYKSIQFLNDDLNKQLDTYELKLQEAEKQLKEQQDDYENKITLLEEDNIKLSKEAYDFQQLERDKNSLQVAYNTLKEHATAVEKEIKRLQTENVKINSDNDVLRESDKKFREAYNDVQQQLFEYKNESDDEIKRLNETISEAVKAYKELTNQKETIEALADEFKKENDEYKAFNNKLIALVETLPHYGKQVQNKPVQNQQKTTGAHGTGNNQFMSDEPVVSL